MESAGTEIGPEWATAGFGVQTIPQKGKVTEFFNATFLQVHSFRHKWSHT